MWDPTCRPNVKYCSFGFYGDCDTKIIDMVPFYHSWSLKHNVKQVNHCSVIIKKEEVDMKLSFVIASDMYGSEFVLLNDNG